jgi:pimeloyl-ACP methyl ester carboxylesterase
MKSVLSIIARIIRWVFVAGIVLFSMATLMGKSYAQTGILLLLATFLACWPGFIRKKWNRTVSFISRAVVIVCLISVNAVFFRMEPKNSIYGSEEHRQNLMDIYDEMMMDWPAGTEDIYIETRFGTVHVLGCGSMENPPLLMIHAASMGAHSWAENLEPLLDQYRIYSIDNIGSGNKSQLRDAQVYPANGKELADLYALIADSLGVIGSPVFGASNGGFVAMNYAYYYPERVESLALFGPMGLTRLTRSSIMMLSLATIYPFPFIRDQTAKWALGEGDNVHRKYGDWFNAIMKGTIPSLAQPVPMTSAQKKAMDLPVLLFLGTKDRIVGDVELARQAAMDFPDIQIEVLESGHLVSVEHAESVNKVVRAFLGLE